VYSLDCFHLFALSELAKHALRQVSKIDPTWNCASQRLCMLKKRTRVMTELVHYNHIY
jgi:hypothetical protein